MEFGSSFSIRKMHFNVTSGGVVNRTGYYTLQA